MNESVSVKAKYLRETTSQKHDIPIPRKLSQIETVEVCINPGNLAGGGGNGVINWSISEADPSNVIIKNTFDPENDDGCSLVTVIVGKSYYFGISDSTGSGTVTGTISNPNAGAVILGPLVANSDITDADRYLWRVV